MQIGLISDTHDNTQNIEKFVKICRNKDINLVIHAGDIVRPESVESFNGVKLVGVLGNNDIEKERLSIELPKDRWCSLKVTFVKLSRIIR